MPNTSSTFRDKQKDVARKTQHAKYDRDRGPLSATFCKNLQNGLRNSKKEEIVSSTDPSSWSVKIELIKDRKCQLLDRHIMKLVDDICALLPFCAPVTFEAAEALIDHRSEQLNRVKIMPKASASNPPPQPQSCLETLYVRLLNSSSGNAPKLISKIYANTKDCILSNDILHKCLEDYKSFELTPTLQRKTLIESGRIDGEKFSTYTKEMRDELQDPFNNNGVAIDSLDELDMFIETIESYNGMLDRKQSIEDKIDLYTTLANNYHYIYLEEGGISQKTLIASGVIDDEEKGRHIREKMRNEFQNPSNHELTIVSSEALNMFNETIDAYNEMLNRTQSIEDRIPHQTAFTQ